MQRWRRAGLCSWQAGRLASLQRWCCTPAPGAPEQAAPWISLCSNLRGLHHHTMHCTQHSCLALLPAAAVRSAAGRGAAHHHCLGQPPSLAADCLHNGRCSVAAPHHESWVGLALAAFRPPRARFLVVLAACAQRVQHSVRVRAAHVVCCQQSRTGH